jgi:regulator of sigma E protease
MTILATIIVLGVLIFVHELGHFGAAKLVGIEVQRFSIGLGPRVWGVTRGETEYVLSAIPLGGYVKMGGMDDEVMERIEGGEASETPRKPSDRDFDAKPLWARAFVISAGVIMNFAFAFVAYALVAGVWGFQSYVTTRVAEVRVDALPAGTETIVELEGARVTHVGSREIAEWRDLQNALMELPAGPLQVNTDDPTRAVDVRLPVGEEERRALVRALTPWVEAAVGAVIPGTPAEDGGLQSGDRLLQVEGRNVPHWFAFVQAIHARPEMRTEILLERDGARLTRVVTPEASTQIDAETGEEIRVGAVGVGLPGDALVYTPLGVTEAVVFGWQETVAVTSLILGFLGDLVTGDVSPRSMGSIVTIGQASGQAAEAGMDMFLRFMALFSVNLAILNLLPIPILDGGHLLFLGIEAVRGRALSVEQRLRWSNVGFLIVMGIMIWALGNDFLRLFGL